jgi:integrase
MGSVFKKTYTKPLPEGAEIVTRSGAAMARWKDKGKTRTAPLTADKKRIRVAASTYTAKFRDGQGHLCEIPTGCRDKTAAEQVLKDRETRADKVRSGMRSAAEDATVDHQSTLIAQHLTDYASHQRAKGRHAGRTKTTRARLDRISQECDFRALRDLDAGKFEAWLDARAAEGMSAGNRNEFRQAAVGFCNWCMKPKVGRLTSNPFASIPSADVKLDRRRQRRAMTEEDLNKLLEAAKTRPLIEARTIRRGTRKGELSANVRPETQKQLELLGWERALIYKTFLLTGLRKRELTRLTVGQLDLTATPPIAILHPSDEKNREGNSIPIRDDLVQDLRMWIAHRQAFGVVALSSPVFNVPAGLLRIFDRDLVAAGLAKAVKDPKTGRIKVRKEDERGRTVDLHALRHSFISLLSKGGVAPRVAQAAARHSEIGLTMNVYTDPKLLDVRGALAVLPKLDVSPVRLDSATSALAPGLAPTSDSTCQKLATCVKEAVEEALNFETPSDDVSVVPVNENSPLTTGVNGLRVVERKGVEPSTSALRTQRSPN